MWSPKVGQAVTSCIVLCTCSCTDHRAQCQAELHPKTAKQLPSLAGYARVQVAEVLCYVAGLVNVKGWMVWERRGSRSAFSHSTYVRPSTAYEETNLPFFDSYAQVCWLHSVFGPSVRQSFCCCSRAASEQYRQVSSQRALSSAESLRLQSVAALCSIL